MKKQVVAFALLSLLIPGLLQARQDNHDFQRFLTDRSQIHPKPKEYFIDVLAPHLWDDSKAAFSGNNVPYWLGAGGAAAMAYSRDQKVRDYFLNEHPLGDAKNFGNFFGEGYTQAGVALAFWGAGFLADNQQIASTGEVLMEAEIINGISTTVFKSIVGRERPDRNGRDSFPSGHSSDTFCFAAVIDHRLGHLWGIPAYSLAVLTGLSRMESDRHYLSDVVMGAGLGMIIGYSVSAHHDDWPYRERWHYTDKKKKLLENAYYLPIIPENGKNQLGFSVYIPVD